MGEGKDCENHPEGDVAENEDSGVGSLHRSLLGRHRRLKQRRHLRILRGGARVAAVDGLAALLLVGRWMHSEEEHAKSRHAESRAQRDVEKMLQLVAAILAADTAGVSNAGVDCAEDDRG